MGYNGTMATYRMVCFHITPSPPTEPLQTACVSIALPIKEGYRVRESLTLTGSDNPVGHTG